MIYVIWKDSNDQVLHGWDTCTPPEGNKVTYQDTPLIHGPVNAGGETAAQIVYLSIAKFTGEVTPPTQPITNCEFKLVAYYSATGVTYNIPTAFMGTYTFCDSTDTSLTYEGYSGSASADADLQTLESWGSEYGLLISMDGGCGYERLTSDTPLQLTGGTTPGEIQPTESVSIMFKVKTPASDVYAGGALQVLSALDYIFTE